MIIFSVHFKGEETTKRKDQLVVSQRHILISNCQTLVAVEIMQTVFLEMFRSVAYSNGVIAQDIHFMQTFNGVSDFNQQKIPHNRWISNMKFIRHTRSCIHQSCLQKAFVTFSERTRHFLVYRKTDAGGKTLRGDRVREREKGERVCRNQQRVQVEHAK